ncbi:hypothetical protein [Arcticibacterium luteifluviistationis]|uniref:hypothetical protein n=1 Tax=Arcticibacterium luteifluviistationis TaxID=1784714 RepID=UPI0019550BB9|nr:hypothetical protein [Arcticibacterium luteifluviistationis]
MINKIMTQTLLETLDGSTNKCGTKAEAFGRIVSHTNDIAGQMEIFNKYDS